MDIATPLGGDGDEAIRHPIRKLGIFCHHLQAQIQFGVELAQTGQARDQPLHRKRAVDREAQPHLAATTQLLAALGNLGQARSNALEIDLPLRRQWQRSPLTQQQPLPQKILQQADLVADRALADVELKGGAGEAQQTGNRLKILDGAQGGQFHYPKIS